MGHQLKDHTRCRTDSSKRLEIRGFSAKITENINCAYCQASRTTGTGWTHTRTQSHQGRMPAQSLGDFASSRESISVRSSQARNTASWPELSRTLKHRRGSAPGHSAAFHRSPGASLAKPFACHRLSDQRFGCGSPPLRKRKTASTLLKPLPLSTFCRECI